MNLVLSFHLCHSYARCTKTMAMPVCIYYAQLLAQRGRYWLRQQGELLKIFKTHFLVKAMLMMTLCRLQVAHLLALHRLMLKKLTASFLFTRIYNMRCSSAEATWLNLAANFDA